MSKINEFSTCFHYRRVLLASLVCVFLPCGCDRPKDQVLATLSLVSKPLESGKTLILPVKVKLPKDPMLILQTSAGYKDAQEVISQERQIQMTFTIRDKTGKISKYELGNKLSNNMARHAAWREDGRLDMGWKLTAPPADLEQVEISVTNGVEHLTDVIAIQLVKLSEF